MEDLDDRRGDLADRRPLIGGALDDLVVDVVRFITWCTSHPRSRNTRRIRSSKRNVRKFPR
jgi:hypothetical protein